MLCIRRTLAHGRITGLVSGLGAATADAFYGFLAAFGLTLVTDMLVGGQTPLRIIGGAFLVYLGIRTLIAKPTPLDDNVRGAALIANARNMALANAYFSTFVLTITNPATIIAFSAIFLSLNVAQRTQGYGGATLVVLGVFVGSALWWLTLSAGVSLMRGFVTPRLMVWVNWFAGAVLILFGTLAMISIFWQR